MFRTRVGAAIVCLVAAACTSPPPVPAEPLEAPASVEAFRAAAAAILESADVPGAGVALVRADGVEWAGGIGFADRDARIPVTADTHFRAGSISKTFVAMALVQQYEDGVIDIESPVGELAPQVAIINPFGGSPVTVLHLLQHTAGFDDMRLNETYNLNDPPDLPLLDVLRRNPASRRVRWRPGTRMSYSNPGYAVAAQVLEEVTGQSYEDIIRERIFTPLGMDTSSFNLSDSDLPAMARGYAAPGGGPVPYSQIYLRPAGNLHTSPAELGLFVQMLLNWGEADGELVIDPEYLSNMERPRSSLSAEAGLIYGYGTGIVSRSLAGFPVLGHNGGIEGFSSGYGYSAARDVGWVVLLNAGYAPEVVDRLSALAVSYLKRDVQPPTRPELPVASHVLGEHEGYYHPDGSRRQVLRSIEWLLGGETVRAQGNALVADAAIGPERRMVPVADTLYRRAEDVTPSLVFTTDEDGRRLMLSDGAFRVRTPRWRVEAVRVPVLTSLAMLGSIPLALLVWLVRPRTGFWPLKLAVLLMPLSLLPLAALLLWLPARDAGVMNTWTRLAFLGSWTLPLASLVSLALTVEAWHRNAGRGLRGYALMATAAGLVLSGFMAAWGLVGLRAWAY